MKPLSAYLSGCTERIARDIWGGEEGGGRGGGVQSRRGYRVRVGKDW